MDSIKATMMNACFWECCAASCPGYKDTQAMLWHIEFDEICMNKRVGLASLNTIHLR